VSDDRVRYIKDYIKVSMLEEIEENIERFHELLTEKITIGEINLQEDLEEAKEMYMELKRNVEHILDDDYYEEMRIRHFKEIAKDNIDDETMEKMKAKRAEPRPPVKFWLWYDPAGDITDQNFWSESEAKEGWQKIESSEVEL